MNKRILSFIRDESATAAIEYSIVLALFGVVVISSFEAIYNESGSQLTNTQGNLSNTAMIPPTPAN